MNKFKILKYIFKIYDGNTFQLDGNVGSQISWAREQQTSNSISILIYLLTETHMVILYSFMSNLFDIWSSKIHIFSHIHLIKVISFFISSHWALHFLWRTTFKTWFLITFRTLKQSCDLLVIWMNMKATSYKVLYLLKTSLKILKVKLNFIIKHFK